MARLTFQNHSSSLAHVRDFVGSCLEGAVTDSRTRHHLLLAVDEAVTALINAENGGRTAGDITLWLETSPQRVAVRLDNHRTHYESPYVTVEELREAFRKGRSKDLSIFVLRQVMDEIRFVYRDGQENQLEMVKYLPPKNG